MKNKVLLSRVVRSARKITGMTLPSVGELYESIVIKKTTDIFKNVSHPMHEFYSVAKSGCSYFLANFHQAAQREIVEGEANKEEGGNYN